MFKNVLRSLGHWALKSSAAGRVISWQDVGRPRWSGRRYDNFSEEGYQKNVIAYRCIHMLATSVASVPWELYEGGKLVGSQEDGVEHKLLNLLDRPNPFQPGPAFMEALVGFYAITGQTYIEGVGPDNPTSPPMELYVHRPDRITIVPGEMGAPQAYEYEYKSQKHVWRINPITGAGPMLHIKTFNPRDDWYGMSPMEHAAQSVDQHNEAQAWNTALLQNSGRPSGALVYAPEGVAGATLSDDQFRQLDEQLDKKLTGSKNARRPLILDGGLDWREMGMSPVEMDWLNGKDSSARDICCAFGTPGQLVGIPDTQKYANYHEARQAYFEDTIIPLTKLIASYLNIWLTPRFGDRLVLKPSTKNLPALELKRQAKHQSMQAADYLTHNEKREATGYDRYESDKADEPADQLFVDAGKLPLSASGSDVSGDEPAIDPATGEPVANVGGEPKLDADGKPIKPAVGAGSVSTGGVPAGPEVQQQALNGVQITAMTGVLQQVSNEEIDPDAAKIALRIAFPSVAEDLINQMVDAADAFVPVKPDPPPMFGGPPGADGEKPPAGKKPPGAGFPPGKKPGFGKKERQEYLALKATLEAEGIDEKSAKDVLDACYGSDL